MKKNILLLISIMLSLCSCSLENKLEITLLDVGKADCSVFFCDNRVMMIDTAEKIKGEKVTNYLKNRRVKDIDVLVITHFDKDHVGGATRVIDEFNIKKIYVPNYIDTSSEYISFKNIVNEKSIDYSIVENKETFKFGKCDCSIYPALDNSMSSNNMSLITKIYHGTNSFLFTGDIMDKRVKEIINESYIQSDFVKIPYHGRYQATSEIFLDKINPKYAAICTSKNEPVDEAIIKLLENKKVDYLSTENGNIYVKSNGKSITMKI